MTPKPPYSKLKGLDEILVGHRKMVSSLLNSDTLSVKELFELADRTTKAKIIELFNEVIDIKYDIHRESGVKVLDNDYYEKVKMIEDFKAEMRKRLRELE